MNAPTLRRLAGLPTLGESGVLPRPGLVLLLIDYQGEYAAGPLRLPAVEAARSRACELRQWAAAAGVPVVHVLHQAAATAPFFAVGSPGAAPLPGLEPAPGEAVVLKQLPSAFAGTALAEVLAGLAAQTVLIAGLMTHNCVDSTARDAFHRGLRVLVAGDASATRDLPGPDGQTIPAVQVHAAVLAGLGDRIAEVLDVATLTALAAA